jgi:CubicO group peptidase (beta-lactamase class C family)
VTEGALTRLLDVGLADGVFPGAVARVWSPGAVGYTHATGVLATHDDAPLRGRATTVDTVYDLASLTKVLCTTLLTALAVGEGRMRLDADVPREWSMGCPGATLSDLLEHCSGLAAHREYFTEVRPFDADAVLARVVATETAYPLRSRAVYSDLGFIILGAWLERTFDCSLDEAFAQRIAIPLGVHDRIGFRPRDLDRIAPTEVYRADLHPDGAPSYVAVREHIRCAHGEVHDDNCWVMGGVAGHAGLFGDADAVLAVARAWLECSLPGLIPALRDRFWRRSTVPGSTRRLGFDGVEPDGSGACGNALGRDAVGHTGFTGTSVWIDPGPRRIYVLLSNRVHPVRSNDAIKRFRPRFHELAAAIL